MRALGTTVCTSCVMDTTDGAITFDSDGVCDHCLTFRRHTQRNWRRGDDARTELRKLVAAIRMGGGNSDFDCIIGMSGGVDSSYLLHLAKVEFGLRPLVFHVDAGWNSQVAVNNIERLVDKLGLDLFTEVINWEEMRDLQLSFFKSGVPQIDTPQDHAFFATMYNFAEKHSVRHILTGGNLSTECVRNPVEWMYYQSDSVQLRDIHTKFGFRQLKTFPVTTILWHKIYLPYVRRIRVHRPLDLVDYNKAHAVKTLTETYGWQPYPQKHFESRFTRFYEGYWLPERFGYDVRKVQFSSLILTGQMTREEALTRLREPALDPATVAQEFEYVANKLEISASDLRGYLTAPKKTYRDYKSQRALYDVGARAMRFLGMEVGGKR